MNDLASILADAWDKPAAREPSWCCRVYVVIHDKEAGKAVAKAAKKLGKIYQAKAYYGLSRALYVGYDNMDGMAMGRAAVIVDALKSAGIACHREDCGD